MVGAKIKVRVRLGFVSFMAVAMTELTVNVADAVGSVGAGKPIDTLLVDVAKPAVRANVNTALELEPTRV